jgi:hypothetical protein
MTGAPNPEKKSDNAILCFSIGAGLAFLAYMLGFGGAVTLALSGGDAAALVGGVMAMIALVLAGVSGFVLMAVGGVWMILRVLADRASDKDEARYRDVQR